MSSTISVVVCAYTLDRWDDTQRAITSVLSQTRRPDQVVVVIDHNDELLALARARWPELTVLANATARGLSGARNTGIAVCDGDIVAFLDDDASARPDWLELLLAPFAEPDVQATGGRAVPLFPADRRPAMLPPELWWVVGCTYTGQPESRADVRNVMGCAMAFRRDVFSRVGGFAEDIGRVGTLPLGCEETELCIRIRQHDARARVVFEPAAVVDHRVGAARTTWRYLVRRNLAEGISKALVTGNVGSADALETERAYVRKVLPRGVLRELRSGRPAGAVAIVVALACATTGYLRGRFGARRTLSASRTELPEVRVAA